MQDGCAISMSFLQDAYVSILADSYISNLVTSGKCAAIKRIATIVNSGQPSTDLGMFCGQDDDECGS